MPRLARSEKFDPETTLQKRLSNILKSRIVVQVTFFEGPRGSTVNREIKFWFSMERALRKLLEQRNSIAIKLTLELLESCTHNNMTADKFDKCTGS